MKITNEQLINIDYTIGEIVNKKMKGPIKFKLFLIKKETESILEVIRISLDGVEEQEKDKILKETVELNINKLKATELEEIELSIRDVAFLEPIIILEEESNE